MASPKVLLLLGAGGNIGANVAKQFALRGYKIALAARSFQDEVNEAGELRIRADLADPRSVEAIFDKVHKRFGPPNVVVYNASSTVLVPADDALDIGLESFERDLVVNTTSVLVAAQQAVRGFRQLSSSSPDARNTFIYTGNLLNEKTMPALISAGAGKSATAHLVAVASESYASKHYRFYYADERKADGTAAFRDISGPNSAAHYLDLAEDESTRLWLQTFVGGKGYVDFQAK